jgi:membrane-associated phospholipid phosphatase
VLVILITYAFRRQRRMLAAIGTLNLAMLFAIPPFGYHYLADMLAGTCVAIVSIVLVGRMFHRFSQLSR